jgi:predicted nucleotidyltransferase
MLVGGLSAEQLSIIREVLLPYSGQIAQVGLFGSRATGEFQPYSDIDLVIYGSLKDAEIDRIRTLFLESNLPVKVDLLVYEQLKHDGLKAHIDSVMLPLFVEAELQSAVG